MFPTLFKDKLAYYDAYRLPYPIGLLSCLDQHNINIGESVIAEFGSGTGKLTRLLVNNAVTIYSIEPDVEMSDFLKDKYSVNKNVHIISATAEKSLLPSKCIDIVFIAQAFHLFNPELAKIEFYRILKPNGNIVFIGYKWAPNIISSQIKHLFYQYGKEQNQHTRSKVDEAFLSQLFFPNELGHALSDVIIQRLDKHSFIKSMSASSYAPSNTLDIYRKFITDAEDIFNRFSVNGEIEYAFNLDIHIVKYGTNTY